MQKLESRGWVNMRLAMKRDGFASHEGGYNEVMVGLIEIDG